LLYGATIVSSTASDSVEPLSGRTDSAEPGLRKKTVAVVGAEERTPDAIVALRDVTVANAERGSRDHWCWDRRATDPIDSVHGCVALMLNAKPSVVCPETARAVVGAAAATGATCTLTRGGTVTLTVWVRLADDPCCA